LLISSTLTQSKQPALRNNNITEDNYELQFRKTLKEITTSGLQ